VQGSFIIPVQVVLSYLCREFYHTCAGSFIIPVQGSFIIPVQGSFIIPV
jgi:hypothetical protein